MLFGPVVCSFSVQETLREFLVIHDPVSQSKLSHLTGHGMKIGGRYSKVKF